VAAAMDSRSPADRCPAAGGAGLHAEVFICTDEAVSQARRFRTSWPRELARYVIHALLHLRGYDDAHPAARRRMKRAEERLLKKVAGRFPLRKRGRASRLAA
jgi:rRNA maturation RNase YbeY